MNICFTTPQIRFESSSPANGKSRGARLGPPMSFVGSAQHEKDGGKDRRKVIYLQGFQLSSRIIMHLAMSVLPDGIKRNLGKATVSHGK